MSFIKKKKIIDENVKIDFITNITSSFFYTGYFPAVSGTVASLAALAIFFLKIFQVLRQDHTLRLQRVISQARWIQEHINPDGRDIRFIPQEGRSRPVLPQYRDG